MTNTDAFYEAFVNIPHTVLGRRLQPLCLFHLLWLYLIQSPLIITNKETTLKDLEIAVLICGSKNDSEIFKLLDGKEQNTLQKISNYFWRRRNRKRDFQSELKKFIAYNDDYIALPRFLPKEDGEANEKIPWLLLHATSLIKATGWSEETVFSMPIGKVMWFNLALGFLATGETRIMSDKEQQAVEALKANRVL
jgi:hypothetical protein